MSAQSMSSWGGHSARVTLRLLVGGGSIPVSQMGPDFLLVDDPIAHPPANAIVVMRVDENERRWNVHLPNGISPGSQRVAIAAL